MQQIHAEVDENVERAQTKQKKAFDERNKVKADTFVIGDKVWLKSLNPKENSNRVLTKKKFFGPFVISAVVEKKSDVTPSSKQKHPNLSETSFGKAFQLTCIKTGRVWRSLIAHRRLKRYVDRTDFNKLYLVRPTEANDETGLRRPDETTGDQVPADSPTEAMASAKTNKRIVRKRVLKGSIQYLMKFTDNSTAWLPDQSVPDELKTAFLVKQSQIRRRRQIVAKRIFQQGYLEENMKR